MHLRHVPASHGTVWIRNGFALYRRQPFGLMANVTLMWLVLMLASSLVLPLVQAVLPAGLAPWVAQAPFTMLLPGLTVGLMNACRLIARDQPALPFEVFSGLRRNPVALLVLGAFYYTGSLAALGLTTALDDGQLLAVARGQRALDDPGLDAGSLLKSGLTLMALSLPVMMANWFAPLLAAWRGLPPVKAAFFSLVAFWRNLGAHTVFGLTLFMLFSMLPAFVGTVFAMVSMQLGMAIMLLLPTLLLPALYGAFYANALDVLPELADGAD